MENVIVLPTNLYLDHKMLISEEIDHLKRYKNWNIINIKNELNDNAQINMIIEFAEFFTNKNIVLISHDIQMCHKTQDLIDIIKCNNLYVMDGWYLVKSRDFNGGLGVWVYNPPPGNPLILNFDNTSPPSATGYYGMRVKPITISCTSTVPAGTNQDNSIQDQTNINVINGPCGADRLQLKIMGFGHSSTVATGETFLPICSAVNTATSAEVNFINNYQIDRQDY